METRRPLIINGYDFGRDKAYGIHRNAKEIVLAMDNLLGEYCTGIDVEIAIPEAVDTIPAYQNVHMVDLAKPHASQADKIRWRSRTFTDYVASRGGIGLDMTLGLPHTGCYCVFDYDCIPERMPNSYYRSLARTRAWHYKNRVRRSLKNALLVFTDSEFAKSEIIKIYNIDSSKIVVIPCAWQHMLRVSQDDSILEKLGLEEGRYFFSLGSRYPYKNFQWVECAARQNPKYHFVVTGSAVRGEQEGESDIPSNLIFTGYLSDEEVKGLEAHCRAFLHPSLAEGFGIPPMEAMSAGAQCVVARAASLPEVYGNSVWYINPNDYDHIDLDEIMSQPLVGTNEEVLEGYSWERSARMLLEALEGVAVQ